MLSKNEYHCVNYISKSAKITKEYIFSKVLGKQTKELLIITEGRREVGDSTESQNKPTENNTELALNIL